MWVAVRGFESLRERSRGSRGRGGYRQSVVNCIVMQANSKEKVKTRKEMVKNQRGNSKEKVKNREKTKEKQGYA